MILDFKIPELQILLGFAGQNKKGRKDELLRRAQNLIQNKLSIPVEMKIRQIYREMMAAESMNKTNFNPYRSFDDNNYYCHKHYSSRSLSNYEYSPNPSSNFLGCETENGSSDPWSRKNGFYESTGSLSSSNANTAAPQLWKSETSFYPGKIIPDRQKCDTLSFKKLSFFRYKSSVIPITPMIPTSKNSQSYEFSISLTLDSQQHSLINWSKKAEKDIRYQVQLRICKLSDDIDFSKPSQVADDLPLQLSVRVSDKSCQLPPAIPSTNKQGILLKRMNAPVNITPQLHRSRPNNLVIGWSVECDSVYGVAVSVVEKYSSADLIDKLKAKGFREAKQTEIYIKNKLHEMVDDDILATSLKTSLICPLSKVKMTLPVRATSCNHLQCFDGSMYLMMNDVKSVWQCPVCNQSCFYEDLYIDGYFANVLNDEKLASANEIQINSDGSIEPVVSKKRKNGDSARETTSCNDATTSKKRKNDDEPEDGHNAREETSKPSCSGATSELPSFIPLFQPTPHYAVRAENESSLPPFVRRTSADEAATRTNQSVVLVDLTESDCEVNHESCQSSPSSSSSSSEEELEMTSMFNGSVDNSCDASNAAGTPPVYSIDEDSSETS